MVGFPSMETLWSKPSFIDYVDSAPSHANDTALFDADV
jgi:hypothetical protein